MVFFIPSLRVEHFGILPKSGVVVDGIEWYQYNLLERED